MIKQPLMRQLYWIKKSMHCINTKTAIRLLSLLVFSFTALTLSGCSSVISMHPKGLIASEEKELFILSVLLMLIVVIPVIILTVYFAWRYRASNKKATYTPNWAHSTICECVWWTIPCIIIAILAVITWISTHKLDPYRPLDAKNQEKPLVIQVVSLDWKWLFIYPEQNIATINYLQIPTHRQVAFKITADAPMSSFIIPQLGGQIYAMAGMQTQLHLIANHPGNYYGFNANYTGVGFAQMHFNTEAVNDGQFNQWVKQVKSSGNNLTEERYMMLVHPTLNNKVQYFSSVAPNLYHEVIMKFMMPSSRLIEKNPKKEEIKL